MNEHPLCLTCNKPVDKMKWWLDPLTRTKNVQVFCHGKMESGELSDFDLGSKCTVTMRCFDPRKLLPT